MKKIGLILTLGISNFMLFLLTLLAFIPKSKKGELLRRIIEQKKYIILIFLVAAAHLIEVNFFDEPATQLVGADFSGAFDSVERNLISLFVGCRTYILTLFFVFIYIIVYPFLLCFSPLLFLVSNERKAMEAFSYGTAITYALALPFYLFFPVTNVYTYYSISSPLKVAIPPIEKFFYFTTTRNNCFPSLHVAMALLIAKSASFTRNEKYKLVTYFCSIAVVASVLILTIHWLMDVLGGLAVFSLVSRIINGKNQNDIEKKVLKKVTPSLIDRIKVSMVVKVLMKKVKQACKRLKIFVKPKLVGSVAKGTYLKDAIDIDIFLLFPKNTSRKELEEKGLTVGRRVLENAEERYAEHPYTRGKFMGYDVEIVPCYEVKDATEKISAVDRTPFHTDYVVKKLPRKKRKEVRLLKQFLKGIGCYGAEAEIQGFSGYLCELLVIKYGSFRKVLEAASKWNVGETIKLEEVESPSFSDPLVVIDPVDPNRNVASALSKEKFDLFVRASREYLRKPSLSFFFPREVKLIPLDEIREKLDDNFVGIKLEKPDIVPDNLYPQIRKSVRRIKQACEEADFEILESKFAVTENAIYLIFKPKKKTLSPTIIHRGPPEKEKEHVERFLKKWRGNERTVKGPYKIDGRWFVEVKRKFLRIEDFLRERLKEISVGKDIQKVIEKGNYEILDKEGLINDDLHKFWTEYLNGRMPWER
ncbi:MAG: CCA tRNA nucleotidyltransferase [Thermoplasmata archaeon]|nr:MAG: CCA tRNA nucleotidyltransferase [Thermoplasmata archaeon]